MALSKERLDLLLDNPRETLDVELKSWIDLTTTEAIAIIARGCLALRNNNGGCILIGFTDDGQPDRMNIPTDVRKMFHIDVVQGIVSQYSSESFSIDVEFVERDGQLYPLISVPSGVRTPVATKRDLGFGPNRLIKDNAVYVRSLSSNNTVSSSEPRRGDWDRLVQICFDNREANIGTFVSRHLSAIDFDQLAKLIGEFSVASRRPTAIEHAGIVVGLHPQPGHDEPVEKNTPNDSGGKMVSPTTQGSPIIFALPQSDGTYKAVRGEMVRNGNILTALTIEGKPWQTGDGTCLSEMDFFTFANLGPICGRIVRGDITHIVLRNGQVYQENLGQHDIDMFGVTGILVRGKERVLNYLEEATLEATGGQTAGEYQIQKDDKGNLVVVIAGRTFIGTGSIVKSGKTVTLKDGLLVDASKTV